jgi:hypothetical protein
MFFGRGKNKIQNPYVLSDMYKDYTEDIIKDSPYDIPYSLYVLITTKYLNKLRDRLYKGFKVWLPYRLGHLQIIKKKMFFQSQLSKNRGINWEATNKYGKVIPHLNEHTGGFKYLYYWDKKKTRINNSKHYRFVPTRELKRTLAYLIKENKQDYFEAH